MPAMLVFFGDSVTALADDPLSVKDSVMNFVYVGIWSGVCVFLGRYVFNTVAARNVTRIRSKYMAAVLAQDMEWHDKHPAAALEIRLTANVPKLQSAMGTKLQMCITYVGGGVGGIAFAFAYSWALTLVALAGCIPLFLTAAITLKTVQKIEEIRQSQYEAAGTVAQEVLALIKVVMLYGTRQQETERYKALICESDEVGRMKAVKYALSAGLADPTSFLLYALVFYYGGQLLRSSDIEVGGVLICLYCVIVGGMDLALIGTFFESVCQA